MLPSLSKCPQSIKLIKNTKYLITMVILVFNHNCYGNLNNISSDLSNIDNLYNKKVDATKLGFLPKNLPNNIDDDKLYDTQELLLAFTINDIPRDHVDIVLKKNNNLYLSQDSIDKLNLNIKTDNTIKYYNKNYYIVSDKNITYSIKQATSTLEIKAPPSIFKETIIEPEFLWHHVEEPGTGAYINYDVLYRYTRNPKVSATEGLWNTTVFHKQNILTSDFKSNINKQTNKEEIIRLESKYVRDFPDDLISLTIGDTRTKADLWGSPILVGGLQIGTNFTLQPGFIYYPLPDITGEASIPSVVDLYINDTNRQRKNIQEGPFEVLDIPTISGSGEIKVIQKDLLGREKEYIVPYYLSSFSLKPGVKDYSVTLGVLRDNFGLASNDYNKLAITGNYREGINNSFTYALRGEFKEKQAAAGIRTTLTSADYGELNLVGVGSLQNQTRSGAGGLFKLVYINQFNKINFNVTSDIITKRFIQLGDNPNTEPYRSSLQTFIGIPFSYNNNLTLSYITRNNRNKKPEDLVTVNYTHNIKNIANIRLSSQVDLNNLKRKVLFLNITQAFPSENITASLASNFENDEKTRSILNVNKSIDQYNGYGYYFRASHKDTTDYFADIKYRNQYTSLQAEYNYLSNTHNYRFSARGGLAYYDKNFFITRRIRDSFAVIDTDNIDNVNIYHNNLIITQTNSNGKAIIPQLISFNENNISIDPVELPLTAKFDKTNIKLIPYRNTGTTVNFDIKRNYSVVFHINNKDKNNKILTGAHITDSEDNLLTIVGYDSYVYLNIDKNSINKKFKAQWLSGECEFNLPIDDVNDDTLQLDIGDITCA